MQIAQMVWGREILTAEAGTSIAILMDIDA